MTTQRQSEHQKTSILSVRQGGERPEIGPHTERRGVVTRGRSESGAAQRLVQGAWRRRYILLLPILLMLPVSLVAAKFLPVPYVATGLLLLQEPGIEGSSGSTFMVSERIEERIGGLEALLRSDRVLSRAVVTGSLATSSAPQAQEVAINDLRNRLALKLVGLDILEIKLKGNSPRGMGHQLQKVVSSFLEALITDQSAMTAGQLIAQDRRQTWEAAQIAYASTLARLTRILPDGLDKSSARLSSLDARLQETRSALAAIVAELNRSKQGSREGSLADLETKRTQLINEIAQGEAEARQLKGLIADYRDAEAQKLRLEAAVAETQKLYAAAADQFEGADEYPQRLLNAPERIRIVDLPGDPVVPETSRSLYLVFGIAAGILLGIGLAWGAEQVDSSLRGLHEFSTIASVPVVAHLLKFEATDVALKRRWSRLWLLVFVIIGAVLYVLWLQFAAPETAT